jgi:hypothetical protein
LSKTKKAPLGFFNKPHCDKNDLVPAPTYSPWFDAIEKHSKSHGYVKLREIEELVGIGLPTTVGYNIEGPEEVCAHFAVGDFCGGLHDGLVHHFFGWAVPHASCVPVIFKDQRIITVNDKNEVPSFVLAWGSSGGPSSAANRPSLVVPGSVEDASKDDTSPHKKESGNDTSPADGSARK